MTDSLAHPVNQRLRWLRWVLIGATLSGMLSCLPLWLPTRGYPLVPVFGSWPVLAPFGGWLLPGVALLSLVAAVWRFRLAITVFLVATLWLYGCDQNRGQPWMYLYWVLLLLCLGPDQSALAAARMVLSLVYFWAGIQKMNGTFFAEVPAWFSQPASDWGLPAMAVSGLRIGVTLGPLLEIFISAGVWFARTRPFALVTAGLMHGTTLLLLGPLGHNINVVIWPWNLAMVALLLVLFGGQECLDRRQTWRELRRSVCAALVVAMFGCLPVLSFAGWWDSYFSFAVYSANVARADVYLTPSFRDRLPARLQTYVHSVVPFDPSFQLPLIFEHWRWGMAELGAPPMPEPRGFAVMFRDLAAYSTNAADCRMIVKTRSGKILLYRPGAAQPVVLKP